MKQRSWVIGKKKAYGKSISLVYTGIKTKDFKENMWFLTIHYSISAKKNFQHRSKSNDIWTTMSFEVWIKYALKIMAAYLSPEVSFLPFLSTVSISPSTDLSQFATLYHADLRIFQTKDNLFWYFSLGKKKKKRHNCNKTQTFNQFWWNLRCDSF